MLAYKQKNNEINDDFFKITIWNKQWFKQFLFDVFINFDTTTIMTNFDIFNYWCNHILSIIINIQSFVNNDTFNVFFF